jgi:hypothetical protein
VGKIGFQKKQPVAHPENLEKNSKPIIGLSHNFIEQINWLLSANRLYVFHGPPFAQKKTN